MARKTIRTPMPIRMRAKQFAMFDALKGLTEAIAEKERQSYPKRELTESRIEEIAQQLNKLQLGDIVTITYYCYYGRHYCTLTERIVKIDMFWKELQIGKISVRFSEIDEIVVVENNINSTSCCYSANTGI